MPYYFAPVAVYDEDRDGVTSTHYAPGTSDITEDDSIAPIPAPADSEIKVTPYGADNSSCLVRATTSYTDWVQVSDVLGRTLMGE